jgi:hypothetical protein
MNKDIKKAYFLEIGGFFYNFKFDNGKYASNSKEVKEWLEINQRRIDRLKSVLPKEEEAENGKKKSIRKSKL